MTRTLILLSALAALAAADAPQLYEIEMADGRVLQGTHDDRPGGQTQVELYSGGRRLGAVMVDTADIVSTTAITAPEPEPEPERNELQQMSHEIYQLQTEIHERQVRLEDLQAERLDYIARSNSRLIQRRAEQWLTTDHPEMDADQVVRMAQTSEEARQLNRELRAYSSWTTDIANYRHHYEDEDASESDQLRQVAAVVRQFAAPITAFPTLAERLEIYWPSGLVGTEDDIIDTLPAIAEIIRSTSDYLAEKERARAERAAKREARREQRRQEWQEYQDALNSGGGRSITSGSRTHRTSR